MFRVLLADMDGTNNTSWVAAKTRWELARLSYGEKGAVAQQLFQEACTQFAVYGTFI